MNQNGETFDWENTDLANLETGQTENTLLEPTFIAETPGIETEADCDPNQLPMVISLWSLRK